MTCPCIDCERKGCGAYHDKCELYKKYKEDKTKINKLRKDMYKKITGWEYLHKGTYDYRKVKFSKFNKSKGVIK